MIKFSQFELNFSFSIEVCIIANEIFHFILLHLNFSLEISQFVWIVWIKRNIFYQMFTFKIFLFKILCCFKIFLHFSLLLLLVRLLNFGFVLLALFFLFQNFINICCSFGFDYFYLSLRWRSILWLSLFRDGKIELKRSWFGDIFGLIWKKCL